MIFGRVLYSISVNHSKALILKTAIMVMFCFDLTTKLEFCLNMCLRVDFVDFQFSHFLLD